MKKFNRLQLAVKTASEHVDSKDIKNLLKMVSLIKEINAAVKDAETIEDITEDHLYEVYSEAIKQSHSAPFDNFTQHNRDAYLRLKFRVISP